MLSLCSDQAIAKASISHPDARLRRLLKKRIEQLSAHVPVSETAHFYVIEHGDPLDVIAAVLGCPILTNPTDGVRYPHPHFSPWWEWLEAHDGWFEAVFLMSDEGVADVVLVPNDDGAPAELLKLCRREASIGTAPTSS